MLAVATLVSIQVVASPPVSERAEVDPFAVQRRSFAHGTLVLSPSHEAAAAVCVAPATSAPESVERELLARGGIASTETVAGTPVWCATVPRSEVAMGLWAAARHASRGAPTTTDGGEERGPRDGAAERLSRLAFEGIPEHGPPESAPPVIVVTSAIPDAEVERAASPRLGARIDAASAPPAPWSIRQSSERLSLVEGSLTAPAVLYGWAAADGSAGERAALGLAVEILSGGQAGRVPRLIAQRFIARRAEPWSRRARGGELDGVWIEMSTRVSIDRARRFVDGTLKQLRLVGPSRKELERARARLRLRALARWEDPTARSRALAIAEWLEGSAARVADEIRALDGVTPQDVRAVARRVFVDARRTTIEVFPPAWPKDDPAVARSRLYTVAPGDTLSSIAAQFHVDATRLAQRNDVDPRYALTVGQALWIP